MSYPGGKNGSGVFQTLINLMPPHDVYIEPFLGGAAVMRLKRPALVNIGIDMAAAPLEIARAAATVSSGVGRSHTATPADPRRRRTPEPAVLATRATNGDTAGGFAETDGARSRFEFHHGDGIEFLRSYPFTGRELVYADPPYLHSTRTGRMLYQHEMSDVDHRRLLRVLRNLPCMVMISGYSSPLYAKELKGWHAASFQTTTRGGKPVAEWVWYNFDRPVELHDYRFLGSDYRERERIKRKKLRWVNRLKTMPALERQALLSAIADTA